MQRFCERVDSGRGVAFGYKLLIVSEFFCRMLRPYSRKCILFSRWVNSRGDFSKETLREHESPLRIYKLPLLFAGNAEGPKVARLLLDA